MLTSLKEKLFQRRLAAETKAGPLPAKPVNLATAKNIVVLFPADDAADRKTVDKWGDGFRKSGMKVKFTGYFIQPVGETDFGFPAVSSKNLSWYGAPQGAEVEAFRGFDCDVLIRLGPATHRELDFLAATKKAKIKVGPHQPGADTSYHLQFDVGQAKSFKDQLAAIERIFSFTNAK